jgi:phage regulator Rha-like protein
VKLRANNYALIPEERIAGAIFVIRGQKVMLDSDLAKLYGVLTKNLNKAALRNLARFPRDFMFQLAGKEIELLRFQSGTSYTGRGGRRYLPYVFTEQGVAMLASVLRSERAVQVNIAVVRAFVKFRQLLASDKNLAHKLAEHDRILYDHDKNIRDLVTAINRLIKQPEPERKPIGFGVDYKGSKRK